ncbi:MAG TPA: hypothetical protein VGO53_16385 [Steroidobacteraceae bacterium]|jgi:hypothetical protein|nr:hypothetical protein [Steroidobacteraceae bacterium]
MQWVRLDSQAMSHPKLLRAGAEAAALWVSGLCHCNTHTTNGRIDADMVPLLYPPLGWAKARKAAQQLCNVGLWSDRGDHFMVHDYEDFQSEATKDAIIAKREYERSRKAEQRSRSHRPGHVPDNVPDMSHGTITESPGLSPRAGVRAGTPASDRPTDRPTDRGGCPAGTKTGNGHHPPPQIQNEPGLSKPVHQFWAIWEELAGGGPGTCGSIKAHQADLQAAWVACCNRSGCNRSANPETTADSLWRSIVTAYLTDRRASGKRIDLGFLCTRDFAGYADLATRNGSTPLPAMYQDYPLPKIPGESS